MKIPLKLKVFTWYLRKGIILTKVNLVKQNWHESTECVFCPQQEKIKHLFFECRFAHFIWSVIQMASKLYPPMYVANVFGNWLNWIDNKFRTVIRVGGIVVILTLWLCRNDKIFNDKNSSRSIPVHMYSPFMVHVTLARGSRPLYGGVCKTRRSGDGHFYTTWMVA